jgi:hypothetical protein
MREFLYIEFPDRKAFCKAFDTLHEQSGALQPSNGGMVEEKTAYHLPNGTQLHEVSFKGDLAGWGAVIEGYCQNRGALFAKIREGCIVLNSGTSYSLKDCVETTYG